MVLHQAERLGGIEALHEHRGGPRVHGAAHQHGAVDVIEGQEDQQAIARLQAQARHELDVVAHQIAVAQHHALGQPGGPAGVGQRHQVALPDGHGRLGRLRRDGDQLGEGPDLRPRRGRAGADGDDVPQPRGPRAHRLHQAHQVVVHHDGHGLGIVELVLDLALAIGRVHGADHGPHPRDGVEGDDVLGAVGGQEADLVAVADAQLAQRVGKAMGERLQLPVGEAHAAEDHGHVLRPALGGVGEHLAVGDVRIGERRPEELGSRHRGCRHRQLLRRAPSRARRRVAPGRP